ncbi:exosome complex component rrp4 [Spatholobus suberectus]|nr:exosome complex component rrp4 [Spatholobus suberectus]
MEHRHAESDAGDVSSAKAVLLGALAPGVNGPTWITLKSTFLMLGLCLAVMLALAFSSSDSWLMFHVAFLFLICLTLFLLLSWFLSQIGLVSIEHQMREMGLEHKDHLENLKSK